MVGKEGMRYKGCGFLLLFVSIWNCIMVDAQFHIDTFGIAHQP